jgi:hypothetical protein
MAFTCDHVDVCVCGIYVHVCMCVCVCMCVYENCLRKICFLEFFHDGLRSKTGKTGSFFTTLCAHSHACANTLSFSFLIDFLLTLLLAP